MISYQYHRENHMKKPSILLLALLLFSAAAFSQDLIRQQSCSNESISKQADSLRELYTKDGYILVREASMSITSQAVVLLIIFITMKYFIKAISEITGAVF